MKIFGFFCRRGNVLAGISAIAFCFVLLSYFIGGQLVLAASEYLSNGSISLMSGLSITVVCGTWLLLPLRLLHIL